MFWVLRRAVSMLTIGSGCRVSRLMGAGLTDLREAFIEFCKGLYVYVYYVYIYIYRVASMVQG